MLEKKYIAGLRKSMLGYSLKRRDVIKQSGDGLHHAKRAIFAMHRDNLKEAGQKLKEVEKIFKDLNKKYAKEKKLLSEGSYNAGLEEYVEASLFYQFLTTGKMGQIKGLEVPAHIYIAGLCDVPGELQRFAVKAATARDIATTKKCAEAAQQITGELIEFNLTSYLRTKFDQANGAVRRIDQVVYELSLRE